VIVNAADRAAVSCPADRAAVEAAGPDDLPAQAAAVVDDCRVVDPPAQPL
jgi:hypothetical protein